MLFRTPAQQFIYHGTLFVLFQTCDRIYEELQGVIEEIQETTMTQEELSDTIKPRLVRLTMEHSKSHDQIKQLRPFFDPMERSFDEAVEAIELRLDHDFERIRRRFSEVLMQQAHTHICQSPPPP